MKKDVYIIGGGASGMLCSIRVKENNPDYNVIILEKQSRLGRKLMSTGNGRCNLTNINARSENYHGSFARYTDLLFEKYSPEYIINTFNSIGLLTKIEDDGRVYPVSDHASSVLDVLRFRIEALEIKVICDAKVETVKKGTKFEISTDKGKFYADSIVFAAGSCACPKLGSSNDGINILKDMGIKTVKTTPALCPVPVKDRDIKQLKGLRVKGKVELIDDNNSIREEYGEIQFTENALSGICIFNLAAYLKYTKNPVIKISLLPEYSYSELYELLIKQKKLFKNRAINELFTGIFRKKLGIALIERAQIKNKNPECSALKPIDLKKISSLINNIEFKAELPTGFDKAQTVSGGVLAEEMYPSKMVSKRVNNLYIIGETVDINGDCGGYNLQFAFASGLCAGDNI